MTSGYFQRLFIGGGREFGTIEIDAMLNERFAFSTTVTDNPVDQGADITDHSYTNPRIYSFVGVVTDTPAGFLDSIETIGNNISGLLGLTETSRRSVAAFLSLRDLWKARELFSVQTAMDLMENMIILDITIDVDQETANILTFTVTMRQLEIVETEIVSAERKEEGDVRQSGTDPQSEGLKQTTNASEDIVTATNRAYA